MSSEDHRGQTRIMLVEDHPDFRELIAHLIGRQPDLEVVAQAGSLAEARSHAAAVRFDVAVLDLGLPDGNGTDLIADLRGTNPGLSVLVLSASLDPKSVERATQAGANEILDKFVAPGELLGTIRHIGTRRAADTV